MSSNKHNSNQEVVFPPIVITANEACRLSALANSSMTRSSAGVIYLVKFFAA